MALTSSRKTYMAIPAYPLMRAIDSGSSSLICIIAEYRDSSLQFTSTQIMNRRQVDFSESSAVGAIYGKSLETDAAQLAFQHGEQCIVAI